MPFSTALRPTESWQERWICTIVKSEKDAEFEVVINVNPTTKTMLPPVDL